MKLEDVKIGMELCCTCGVCIPFTVTYIGETYIRGRDANNEDSIHIREDLDRLRPLTKLQKALK